MAVRVRHGLHKTSKAKMEQAILSCTLSASLAKCGADYVPKRSENLYSVGKKRLNKARLVVSNFDREDIVLIGFLVERRQTCLVGRVGNKWTVRDCEEPRFTAYYQIVGKRVKALQKSKAGDIYQLLKDYECEDTTTPLYAATTKEIFQNGKGVGYRKKCQIAANRTVTIDRKTKKKVWGSMAKREVCGLNEPSATIEQRNKAKRGERNHLRALIRKANAKQARY